MTRKNKNYDSEAGRFFESDVIVTPLIKGMQKYERALSWHREAHKRNVDSEIKQMIAKKLKELE